MFMATGSIGQTERRRHMDQELTRRDAWSAAATGLLGVLAGATLAPRDVQAQSSGFQVVTWKWFTNPSVDFTTASTTCVPSNLPTNPTFVKQRSDTCLLVICAVDIVPTQNNSIFNAIFVDDSADCLQVSIAGPPNQLVVVNMVDILAGIPAGSHTFKYYVASNGGQVTWRTPVASFKIIEIAMPALQT
jgi:hypothetical protein